VPGKQSGFAQLEKMTARRARMEFPQIPGRARRQARLSYGARKQPESDEIVKQIETLLAENPETE